MSLIIAVQVFSSPSSLEIRKRSTDVAFFNLCVTLKCIYGYTY